MGHLATAGSGGSLKRGHPGGVIIPQREPPIPLSQILQGRISARVPSLSPLEKVNNQRNEPIMIYDKAR